MGFLPISVITDEFASKFIKNFLGEVTTGATSKLKQVIHNRILEHITATSRKCSFLKTILHKDNIEIDKIFFPLRLRENSTAPQSVKELFEKNSRIVIVGQAGSGKTTFIKYHYINAVKTNFKIPILLNLRDFNSIDFADNRKKKEIINNVFYSVLINHLLFNKIAIDTKNIMGCINMKG